MMLVVYRQNNLGVFALGMIADVTDPAQALELARARYGHELAPGECLAVTAGQLPDAQVRAELQDPMVPGVEAVRRRLSAEHCAYLARGRWMYRNPRHYSSEEYDEICGG